MNSIAFKAGGNTGDYVKATVVAENHSDEAHFGLLDGIILAFFLICVVGLVYMFAH
jgi:endonuclease V-like protein UPF0215 family